MTCQSCPVGPGCRGEKHPRLCELQALDPRVAGHLRSRAGIYPPRAPAIVEPANGRVRVGLLCPQMAQGGAEQWQVSLARTVDPARVSWRGCAILSTHEPDAAMVDAHRAYMPVEQGVRAARALAADCDVLVHWAIADLGEILTGLEKPPKTVQICHSPSQSAYARTHYAKTAGTDKWVAVSEFAREAVPDENVSIVWNCVDTDRLMQTRSREDMHASWGVPPGALVAGYYGRIAEEKGPGMMIDLAKALPPPWHVAVVGPDHLAGLEKPTLHNLHWPGADRRAGDVLRAFDVLVVPSDYESFGLTIAEGLWLGVPVVTTPVGIAALAPGITRVVPHGASGPQIAREVEAAVWAGRPPGQLAKIREVLARLDPAKFGVAWTEILTGMAP